MPTVTHDTLRHEKNDNRTSIATHRVERVTALHASFNTKPIAPTMKHTHIKEIRIGLIVARIRLCKTRDGVRHSITVARLYRNGDHWKESSRFGRDDIPLVRLALDQAHAWILQQTSRHNTSRTNTTSV